MLKQTKPFTNTLFLILFFGLTYGKVVFKDDFSEPARSNINWVTLSEDDTPLKFTNSRAELINNSSIYSAFAFHKLENSIDSFSYSATFVDPMIGSGLFYCSKKVNGRYSGYQFLVAIDLIGIFRVDSTGEETEIFTKKCNFLKMRENKLTISGNKERLHIFCNGYYQFSIQNQMGELQEVGIVSPPLGLSLLFDDVIVEDKMLDSTCFKDFSSEFYDTGFTGWAFGGIGTHTKNGKTLKIITKKKQYWFGYTLFPLDKFSITAVIKFDDFSNVAGNVAGIYLIEKMDSTTMSVIDFFVQAGDDDYSYTGGKYKKDLITGIGTITNDSLHFGGVVLNYKRNELDTLKVERNDSCFSFTLGNFLLTKLEDKFSVFEGAGIFVGDSTSLSLVEFSISNLKSCEEKTLIKNKIKSFNFANYSSPLPLPNSEVFIDFLGRSVNQNYITKKPFTVLINKKRAYLFKK